MPVSVKEGVDQGMGQGQGQGQGKCQGQGGSGSGSGPAQEVGAVIWSGPGIWVEVLLRMPGNPQ